jgi:sarcosine oxidase gamma subunit
VTVRGSARLVDLGDVRLEVGHAIRGRVRTKAGAPIADAVVRVRPRESRFESGLGPGVEARSEADGSFVLAGVTPAVSVVTAEAVGFGPQEKTTEPDGEPLELVLDPAGSVRGLIVDERSRPVEGFQVMAQSALGSLLALRGLLLAEDASGDGRFTLSDVPPGVYTLSVTAPDLVSANVTEVKVAEGQVVDVGTVRMSGGGMVRGTVVDEQGSAVAGATVSVAPSVRAMFAQRGAYRAPEPTVSDGSGAFELRALGEGELDVNASHPSFVGAEPVMVRVDARRPATDVRLVLTRGGRIEGSVRGRDGSPRAGQSVQASPSSPGPYFQGSTTTAADGSFVIEHVPAGPVGILVSSGASFAPQKTVDVRDGETATVEIVVREILLGGHVTRSGAPGSGLRIRVSNTGPRLISRGAAAGTPPWWTADTREDGSFEMFVHEPGTYHLAVSSTDGKTSLPSRTVEVPDADAHSVEIVYGGVPVAGVVIDADTEAPIAYAQVGARGTADANYGDGTTGADGRFQLELEPDDYTLSAHAFENGYLEATTRVAVRTGTVGDVRLALAKGLKIAGKVVDVAGRPAGDAMVRTVSTGQGPAQTGGMAHTLADGSFAIGWIAKGTYTLLADQEGMFAIRPGVAAGSEDAVLSLQPGGRVTVTVTGPNGAPLAGAVPLVTRVNGLPVGFFGRPSGPTDGTGRAELLAPAGDLVLWARTATSGGSASVSVVSGQTAAVSIEVQTGAQAPR